MNNPPEPPFWLSALLVSTVALMVYGWGKAASHWLRGDPAVEASPRGPVPWGLDGTMLAIVSLAIAWLSATASWLDEVPANAPRLLDAFGFMAISGLLAGAAVLGIVRMHPSASPADFGLPHTFRQLAGDAALGVVCCAAMLPIVYTVQTLIVYGMGLPSSHPTIEALLKEATPEVFLAAGLMAVVVAPLFEELAFRVLLQGWLERLAKPGSWGPVVGASAAFALAHAGQGLAPAPLFVLSLGIGYLYRQTHRYAPCVFMHMAFNAFSLAMAIGYATQMAPPP